MLLAQQRSRNAQRNEVVLEYELAYPYAIDAVFFVCPNGTCPSAQHCAAPEIPKFDPLPATPVQDPYDPALSSTDGLYRPPVPGAAPAPVGQGTGRSAEFNPAANDGLYHPSEYLLLV